MIEGENTGLNYPQKVALDARGNISALNIDNSITVYPAGSTGNVTPSATINVGGNIVPAGIARGSGGELYVADQGFVQCNKRPLPSEQRGSVDVYPAKCKWECEPQCGHRRLCDGIASPSAIAVSKRGNHFRRESGSDGVFVWMFPRPARGASPFTLLVVRETPNLLRRSRARSRRSESPGGVAVDSSRKCLRLRRRGHRQRRDRRQVVLRLLRDEWISFRPRDSAVERSRAGRSNDTYARVRSRRRILPATSEHSRICGPRSNLVSLGRRRHSAEGYLRGPSPRRGSGIGLGPSGP